MLFFLLKPLIILTFTLSQFSWRLPWSFFGIGINIKLSAIRTIFIFLPFRGNLKKKYGEIKKLLNIPADLSKFSIWYCFFTRLSYYGLYKCWEEKRMEKFWGCSGDQSSFSNALINSWLTKERSKRKQTIPRELLMIRTFVLQTF